MAWPWSLNISGESFFFKNEKDLLVLLEKKIKSQKNIDIGCMQISYKYHNKNFKSIEEISDPKKNIEWAALYLKKLFNKHNSWNKAIAKYHSSNPKRMKNYLTKVHKNWRYVRQNKKKSEVNLKSIISPKNYFLQKTKIKYSSLKNNLVTT